MKLEEIPYMIHAVIESVIKKIDNCKINPENIPCGFSMSKMWAIDNIENKYSLYRRKGHMKKLYKSLRKYTKKYNWFWNKMSLLTKKELVVIIKMQWNVS